MFCEKCGHQMNDTAAFCPKCGAPVKSANNSERTEDQNKGTQMGNNKVKNVQKQIYVNKPMVHSASQDKQEQGTDTAKSKEEEKPTGKIGFKKIFYCFCAICICWAIIGYIGDSIKRSGEEQATQQLTNNNLGGTTPEEIGVAYVNALKSGNFSSMNLYLDQNMNYSNVEESFIKDVEENKDFYSKIDLNSVTIKLGETTPNDQDLYDGVLDLSVKDTKILGKIMTTQLFIHQRHTPQGIRWFYGKVEKQ